MQTEVAVRLEALVTASAMDDLFRMRPIDMVMHSKAMLGEIARLAREDLASDGAPMHTFRGSGAEREVVRRELRLKSCT